MKNALLKLRKGIENNDHSKNGGSKSDKIQ